MSRAEWNYILAFFLFMMAFQAVMNGIPMFKIIKLGPVYFRIKSLPAWRRRVLKLLNLAGYGLLVAVFCYLYRNLYQGALGLYAFYSIGSLCLLLGASALQMLFRDAIRENGVYTYRTGIIKWEQMLEFWAVDADTLAFRYTREGFYGKKRRVCRFACGAEDCSAMVGFLLEKGVPQAGSPRD